MDANYRPSPHTTKVVELQLQALCQRLPSEWAYSTHYDEYTQAVIIRLERLVAELDTKPVDFEYEHVPYQHIVKHPKTAIDYLKVWLIRTFPLMTAPAWQPDFKWYVESGFTVHQAKHIYQTTKIVAKPGTARYTYHDYRRDPVW